MSLQSVTKTMPARPQLPAQSNIEVLLHSITHLAENISSFEFVAPEGKALPAFSAGSHIDVHLPNGVIRQYSLCNDSSEQHRYVVAVLRDALGRGGSKAMHDELRVGARVTISAPRNHFALVSGVSRHVFVAGGIGITPIMSMIAQARAKHHDFHLYYCARSPQRTAFLAELAPLIELGYVTLHYDGGELSNSLDLKAALRIYEPGTHLYYCGPAGLLKAVEAASVHWPAQALHCERFSGPAAPAAILSGASEAPEMPFDVELAKAGRRFTVKPGQTIVDVLKANGIEVDVSCQQGYCGTCMTRYLSGKPLHRDCVLDEEDREEFVMICCSRAKTETLVLDL